MPSARILAPTPAAVEREPARHELLRSDYEVSPGMPHPAHARSSCPHLLFIRRNFGVQPRDPELAFNRFFPCRQFVN